MDDTTLVATFEPEVTMDEAKAAGFRGGYPSSGISSGDALVLPERHPACRRHEARPGFRIERANLRFVTPTGRRLRHSRGTQSADNKTIIGDARVLFNGDARVAR
jgi:hypothetical protein